MLTQDIATFRASLPPRQALIGLDVGSKTIGIAISDPSWMIATPHQLYHRRKQREDVEAVRTLSDKEKIGGLVIGNPMSMDGKVSPQTQSVQALAKVLDKELGLPILMWDERMSTMAVTRTLLEADVSRARRKELVDKMAAAYILQGVLDSLPKG